MPSPQKCETNPIYAAADLWKTQMRETNPIAPPLLPIAWCLVPVLCETNPKDNAGRRPATPIFNPGLSAGDAPHPELCETNPKNNAGRRPATPIFNPPGSGGYADTPPKMRNEPNLPPPPPKCAKQTQSPPISSLPRWPKVSPGAPGNPIPAPRRLSHLLLSPFAYLAGNSPRPINPCDIST